MSRVRSASWAQVTTDPLDRYLKPEIVGGRLDIVDDEGNYERAVAWGDVLAEDSRERREEDARVLATKNAAMRISRESTVAQTDDDITDEAVWQYRAELATASQAKKAVEAQEMAKENQAIRKRLEAAAIAKTDDDITDEAVWQYRAELAIASQAKKAVEAQEMAEENQAIRKRLEAAAVAKTDDDITDEAVYDIPAQTPTHSHAQQTPPHAQSRPDPPTQSRPAQTHVCESKAHSG